MSKTALITGAARRIGAFLAKGLAKNGYDIVLHYSQSEEDARQVAEEIHETGRKCYLLQQDLNKPDASEKIFSKIRDWHLKVDTLIHNASVFEAVNFEQMTEQQWQQALQVNLTAPVVLNQFFVNQLGTETGSILHLLDWRALRPGKDHFPYTISKAALASVTKALAVSLAPQVRVNGLALGAILPPADEGDTGQILKNVPLKRWAELGEVLEAVLYLLNGSNYITGEILSLDGGRHLV